MLPPPIVVKRGLPAVIPALAAPSEPAYVDYAVAAARWFDFSVMNDSEFDDLIRAAGERVPLPPSFRSGVWHRIESAAAPAAGPGWLSFFSRPLVAGASMATALAIGVFAGVLGAPSAGEPHLSYVESVSPFAHSARK